MDKTNGLGRSLRALRKMRGMTQAKLGALTDIHPSSICGIEAGRQTLTVGNLQAITDALGFELDLRFRPKAQGGQ